MAGSSSGLPNWHHPCAAPSWSKTSAACARSVRTRSSLIARWLTSGPRKVRSGWKPTHQHPPKIPLLRSTSSANAGQVEESSGRTVYEVCPVCCVCCVFGVIAPSCSRLVGRRREEPGQLGGPGENRPMARVDVDELDVLRVGQFRHLAGRDPLARLGRGEFGAHDDDRDV